jgi:hypothetical protein
VRDGVDGLQFVVRSSESLANVMARAMTEKGLWDRLSKSVQPPPTAEVVAQMHIAECYGVAGKEDHRINLKSGVRAL